jgi:hypothetical protein
MKQNTRSTRRLADAAAPAATVLLVVLAAVATTPTTYAARMVLQESTGFHLVPNTAIQGQDINCGQSDYNGKRLSYCKICNGLTAAATACQNNPFCEASIWHHLQICSYTSPSKWYCCIVCGSDDTAVRQLRHQLTGLYWSCSCSDAAVVVVAPLAQAPYMG